MNTDIRTTAKIYQFPTRERRVVRSERSLQAIVRDAERDTVSTFSGWYHDAAIQDEKSRKP